MSRVLRLTPEAIERVCKKFEDSLKSVENFDEKYTYTENFKTGEKTTVWFTPDAWTKMVALIHDYDSEVGWHGIASRTESGDYIISDILVYPQEVSGATVNTDQEEYEMWMMKQEDDVYNNIRMHGHSHVRMSPGPSGVDDTHREKIVEQLEGDMFYIFMIWNKEFKYTAKIYDMKRNVLFDTEDISVQMVNTVVGLDTFLKNAKAMVKPKKVSGAYNGYNGAYGGYGGNYNGGYQPAYHNQSGTQNNLRTVTQGGDTKPAANQNSPGSVPSRQKGVIGAGWSGIDRSKKDQEEEDDYPYDDSYYSAMRQM